MHHNMLINGQKLTQADIESPTRGVSIILSRASKHPTYPSELLQISTLFLFTKNGKGTLEQEARVFRFQNGELSLWNTDDNLIVTEKITDMTLKHEISSSLSRLKAVQQPWVDGNGENKYLGLKIYWDEEPCWTMHHKIKQGEEEMVQGTKYCKLPEDRQEGWLSRLAEGAKLGVLGTKELLSALKWMLARAQNFGRVQS